MALLRSLGSMQILNCPCGVETIISDETHGVGFVTFARTISFSNRVSSVSTLSLDATCTFLGACSTSFTVLWKWMWCFPGSFSRPVKTSSYSRRMVYSVLITWLSTLTTRQTVSLAMTPTSHSKSRIRLVVPDLGQSGTRVSHFSPAFNLRESLSLCFYFL